MINDNPGNPGNPAAGDKANMPQVAAAPDGTVYVSWTDIDVTAAQAQGTIMIDKSSNGGATWGADWAVLPIWANPWNVTTASGAPDVRATSYPAIDVSPFNSSHVYIVYSADPDYIPPANGPDEGDIFFIKSTDGGVNWSTPLRVNDDATTNDNIEPWIDVKPDGTIDVVWYDRRLDPNDYMWDVYIASSTDGGNSFSPNVRVTDQSFASPTDPWGTPWMGEYIGLAVDATDAYIAFTSSVTDSLGDVYFDTIPNSDIIVSDEDEDGDDGEMLMRHTHYKDSQRERLGGKTKQRSLVIPKL
jgi:hypothetical protein